MQGRQNEKNKGRVGHMDVGKTASSVLGEQTPLDVGQPSI